MKKHDRWMHSDSPKQETEELKEYNFIRETIKEKPVNKKEILYRIAAIAAGAVLFGVIASGVIAVFCPKMISGLSNQQEPPKVNIDTDDPSETPTPEATATPAPVVADQTITLEDYERIFQDVRQVAETPLKAMVTVAGVKEGEDLLDHSYVSYGQSAGVIIAENSQEIYVLTEKGALGKDSKQVQVTFRNEEIAQGSLAKSDSGTGLAVIAVPTEHISQETKDTFAVATLGNSYSLMQGKPVIAIGSPSGYNEAVAYGNIISVSNKVSVVDAEYNLLVTDIPGSQEGSGVLLDTTGNVVGIIAQSFGEKTDTMVKALSISQLKSLLGDLSNSEDISYVGIYGEDVTKGMARETKIPQGIYVDSVATDSPAMEAGIQSADVITDFNGKEVTTMQKFSAQLQKCKKDEKVKLVLQRKGNDGYVEMKFEITIGVK